jgi:hypothetical protein
VKIKINKLNFGRGENMDQQKELIKEQRRKYHREYARVWRARNKDRVKQHQETFYLRQAGLQVECRALESLENELQELKQRAYIKA